MSDSTPYSYPSVLTIAGFDGIGGAGIQGDIKTISSLGCYAMSVLTALPIQNTSGVKSIHPIPATVVGMQLETILEDIKPDAIKIGMVHSPELITIISEILTQHLKVSGVPIVFDPVMVSTSGHRLMEAETVKIMIQKIFPIATLITPNIEEAEVLTNLKITQLTDMYEAGALIQNMGCKNLLLKGGHLKTNRLSSLYFSTEGTILDYHSDKYITNNTRGTGCALSAAIASYLALGFSMKVSIEMGQEYIKHAIFHSMDVKMGKGNGPLNHFFDPKKLVKKRL